MSRYLLKLSFVGTELCGWQVQPNGPTVQAAVCKAAEEIFGVKTNITGCSRTDSGVHAYEFYCHFDAETEIPPQRLVFAFNHHLPQSIAAVECKPVEDDFHARYSATGKTYIYKILNSPHRNPFMEGLYYHHKGCLDVAAMASAAEKFVGTYDFSAFCAADTSVEDKVRTIYSCKAEKIGDTVEITVSGNGFLYNMVRIIAGTLLSVGMGKIEPKKISEIIASCKRENAGTTLPACGLYLKNVHYDEMK